MESVLYRPAIAQPGSRRYPLPDIVRGCAVVLMIVYHLLFDLTLFRFLDASLMSTPALHALQRLCMCGFLFCVGWSSAIAHAAGFDWRAFWRRQWRLLMAAVAISVVTYWVLPKQWIFFGILHFIFLASLLIVPFVKRPLLSLVVAMLILMPYVFWHWQLPWFDLPHAAADYVPLTPWIAWVLLGVAARAMRIHEVVSPLFDKLGAVRWLGRHSLAVYLLHQPVLWGLLWLLGNIA